MKTLAFYALFFLSLSSYGQFTKENIEEDFPLLTLPYDTKGVLFRSYTPKSILEPSKTKFIKAEISDIIKKYQNTNLIINTDAKHYAIGRLNYADRNYILYLETSMNPDTKSSMNEIFIVSLDEAYQPINAQSISYYSQEFQEIKNPDSQIIKTDHSFALVSNKDKKLNIALTVINQEDKFPGDIHLQYNKHESEHYFDEDGRLNEVYK